MGSWEAVTPAGMTCAAFNRPAWNALSTDKQLLAVGKRRPHRDTYWVDCDTHLHAGVAAADRPPAHPRCQGLFQQGSRLLQQGQQAALGQGGCLLWSGPGPTP
jgi:hypothetical protein